jgi:hypothetical protein
MMMTTTHLTVKRSGLISAPYVLLWELDTNFKVASNPCSFSYSFTSESSWCGNPELTCTGSASRTWDQPRVLAPSTRAPDINKFVSNNHHPRTPHTLIESSMATNQWIAFVTCEPMNRSRSWRDIKKNKYRRVLSRSTESNYYSSEEKLPPIISTLVEIMFNPTWKILLGTQSVEADRRTSNSILSIKFQPWWHSRVVLVATLN